MSVLAKGLRKAGVDLVGDMPPAKQRGGKWWQRVIASVRAAEAAELDLKARAERELNEALEKCLSQQERIRQLEGELLRLRLKAGLEGIESLTVTDRTKLLELSTTDNSGH